MNSATWLSLVAGCVLLPLPAAAQTTWLASGSGDGFAAFPVGPFGEISAVGGDVGTWDPLGAEQNAWTAYNTFLVVSDRAANPGAPVGHTLYQPYEGSTYNTLGALAASSVNLVEVSLDATTRVTTFDLPAFAGMSVRLSQVATTSTLTQTYTFSNAGPTQTLTLARFSDIDLELGGGAYTDNWGFYDAVNSPLAVSISDVSQTYWATSSLGGAVVPEGARVYMRLANAGGGNHDRVPVTLNLGHPASRLIFEACVYGAQASYGDCGTSIDTSSDGVTDMTGDLGVTIQGTLVVPAGGSAVAIVTLDYSSGCLDSDADGLCDAVDNCPVAWNPSQNDSDANGLGDACDPVCLTTQRGTSGTVEDAFVSSASPTTNYGASGPLQVGASLYRSFLQFSVGAPAGAVVTQADLVLYQASSTGAGTIDVRSVLGPWTEAAITFANKPPTATVSDGSGPIVVGAGSVSFSLTALVQAWLSGAQPNHGVIMTHNLGAGVIYTSSDIPTVSRRPALSYCYVIPG